MNSESPIYVMRTRVCVCVCLCCRVKKEEASKEFFMGRVRERLPVVVKNLEALITDEAGWILSPEVSCWDT